MEKPELIVSDCGRRMIEVVRDGDGYYCFRQFVHKYDAEEEASYDIRELPDPTGRFGDFETAVKEAERFLGM